MNELLWQRKSKFIRYLIASFMFIINQFVQIFAFSIILGSIESIAVKDFGKIVWIAVFAGLYSAISFLISRLLRIGFMKDTIFEVRMHAFDKIMRMPFKKFSKKSKDIYLSNLVNDINSFEENFFVSLLNFLINIGMFFLSLIVILVIDPIMAGIMVLTSIILYAISYQFSKKTVALQEQVSKQNETFTTEISNTFQGLEILKLNRIDNRFLHKSMDSLRKLEMRKYLYNVFAECQRNVINVLGYVVICGLMVYLCVYYDKFNLTIASILFQLGSSMAFNLIEAFPLYNKIKAATRIYSKITEDEAEEQQETVVNRTEEFEFQHKIEVKHVSFSYEGKQVLKDISFTIEKGKKYLIKGVSGSGKSTLMNLLSLIYDNYEGQITADGVDYLNIKESSFHNKVSFIYQNVFLFEESIRNNITLYKDIPAKQLDFAVKACNLSDMIQSQPNGLDQVLMENGKNLSGGQRQRLSIARAIAKNAEILFVDEGTSSLNEELGKEIEKVFLSLEQTVISISHRYYDGVSELYDYVLEIQDGTIHEYKASEYFGEVVTC